MWVTCLSHMRQAFLRVAMSHAQMDRIDCWSLLTNRHIRVQMYTANVATLSKLCLRCVGMADGAVPLITLNKLWFNAKVNAPSKDLLNVLI